MLGLEPERLTEGRNFRERCKHGLNALRHYKRQFNARMNEFTATPVHDSHSHGADAFRTLSNRIAIFASLPLRSLDKLTLQRHIDDIGKSKDSAA